MPTSERRSVAIRHGLLGPDLRSLRQRADQAQDFQPPAHCLIHSPSRRLYGLLRVTSARWHRYEDTWPRGVWSAPEILLSCRCREGRQKLSAQVHDLSCHIIGRYSEVRNGSKAAFGRQHDLVGSSLGSGHRSCGLGQRRATSRHSAKNPGSWAGTPYAGYSGIESLLRASASVDTSRLGHRVRT